MACGIVLWHGYDGVDMRIVWDTVSEDIPRLRMELAAINASVAHE